MEAGYVAPKENPRNVGLPNL